MNVGVFLLGTCSVYALIADGSPDELESVKNAISRSAMSWDSIFIEYDMYVFGADSSTNRDRKTTVIEAMDSSHHLSRIIHWYYRPLYDFRGRADLDPLLNWVLWTPSARQQQWETTRLGVIGDGSVLDIEEPYLQLYTSYLGRLSPQHRAPVEPSETRKRRYSSGEYYFPWALNQPGWILERNDGTGVCISRTTETVTDRITCDVNKSYAITEREVQWKDGTFKVNIVGEQFQKIGNSAWLPAVLQIRSTMPYYLEFRARRLEVGEFDKSCFERSFLPGTIVTNRMNNSTFTVAGGEEMLDTTVERMVLAQRYFSEASQDGMWLNVSIYAGIGIAVLLICALVRQEFIRRSIKVPMQQLKPEMEQ
jgi:hypothetical protein